MLYGYAGKLLFVNLSDNSIEERELTEEMVRNWIGGYGFGAKILYDEMPANTEPFAPESMVGFCSGPTNGSKGFFGGRYMVVSKSPVYNGWNDANSGGYFGPMMKKAGFDAVFVKGIAEKPVYIYIDNGKVEIRDAAHLWGKRIIETEEEIRKTMGRKKWSAALIGPAGERLSWMACVMNDEHRAAARGGTGAVMGSKKLKGVVVTGNKEIPVYDPDWILEFNRKKAEMMIRGEKMNVWHRWATYGTTSIYNGSLVSADAGVKNWGGSAEKDFPEEIAKTFNCDKPEFWENNYKVSRFACSACAVGCGATYEITDPKIREKIPNMPVHGASRPEYETMGGLASCLLNPDGDSMTYVNYLINDHGYDTIAFGGTMAWAMECFENGVLTEEDLNGVALHWGDPDAINRVAEMICANEGRCGELLQNGSRHAAETIGKGFEYLATMGGIEAAQHDGRNSPQYAVGGAYDPTPGRHTKSATAGGYRAKPPEIKYNARGTGFPEMNQKCTDEFTNAAGFCRITGGYCGTPDKWALFEHITGFRYTPLERHMTGARIFHMRNAFNVRDGWKRGDFEVTPRLLHLDEDAGGAIAGVTIDIDPFIDAFYEAMGCNLDGKPYKDMLEWIGDMDEVIKDLY